MSSNNLVLEGQMGVMIYGPWEGDGKYNVVKVRMGTLELWALNNEDGPDPDDVIKYVGETIGTSGDQLVKFTYGPDKFGTPYRIIECG